MPFTSPMLAGARVRLIERRCDLVVPHPGRARGVYIFALSSLSEYCAPTMHDLRLASRLADLGQPTPGRVRLAARKVALEGAAGRAASARAAMTEEADARARTEIEATLLAAAMGGQAETGMPDPLLVRAALLKVAGRTGRTPEAVKAEVERLAYELVVAGLTIPGAGGLNAAPARCDRLLDAVGTFAAETKLWLAESHNESAFGRLVAASQATYKAGRLLMEVTHVAISDPSALLSLWAAEPEQIIARVGRLDWLLDGWEHLCLVWQLAHTDLARHQALDDAVTSLPTPPAEAQPLFRSEYASMAGAIDRPAAPRPRAVPRPPGEHAILIDRNEQVRSLAA